MKLLNRILIAIPAFLLIGAGCTLPNQALPPPSLQLVVSTLDKDPLDKIRHKHTVGKNSCPDPLEPFMIEPRGGEVTGSGIATTDVKWLLVPDKVEIGEPIELKFNCDIDDLSPHIEEGSVEFQWDFGDGSPNPEAPAPVHEFELEPARAPVKVQLKVEMEICNVGQLCPPPLES